ncbi:Sjogren's syndrome/scleroderma autoantigen 1 family protein [Halosimplex halophilum]|uniref:Sjogren's syndrome/scleroderma autoantigen 1 family protein n=1 Tax=Halosimplex halophilum TaxID=2559572 RepID=UPI00107F1E91|nr:Sjogren's syndrome/scleroderma autoantigen 1 family protein [Halosimplex halophilum]
MSDFDKEAERERLREKYEQDKQKREASERMSDLLLKGATMTNAHCNDCGDPIFRYDGDEFCPTCQRVVTNDEAVEEAAEGDGQVDEPVQTPDDGGAADAGGPDQGSADAGDASADRPAEAENGDTPGHIEIKQPDGPAVRTGADASSGEQATAEGSTPSRDPEDNQSQATRRQPSQSQATRRQSSQSQSGAAEPNRSRDQPSRTPSTPERAEAPVAEADDEFGAARASLVRTLRKQAERAENCEDPRRARDHLAAAREAAEALGALSGSY